jgi:hypothetical protein
MQTQITAQDVDIGRVRTRYCSCVRARARTQAHAFLLTGRARPQQRRRSCPTRVRPARPVHVVRVGEEVPVVALPPAPLRRSVDSALAAARRKPAGYPRTCSGWSTAGSIAFLGLMTRPALVEILTSCRAARPRQRMQIWRGRSLCRCGRGEPSPGTDVAGVSPVPAQMWQG